ncbi:hypothetical protein WJX74_004759 [Apatococcus lobatus]|uniref:Uncharacterized protein n=1 Tax=Apatococcus lobatus TaxID=904363 RepID=A0AAW1QU64_9CHLO
MRWFFGKESRRKPFGKGTPVTDSRQLLSLNSDERFVVASDRRQDHEGELYSDIQRNNKLRLQLESDVQSKTPAQRLPQGTTPGPDLLSFDEDSEGGGSKAPSEQGAEGTSEGTRVQRIQDQCHEEKHYRVECNVCPCMYCMLKA